MTGPGNDDERVQSLWQRIDHRPENEAQRTLIVAWDAVLLVNSDGIEKLFEQEPSMQEFGAALTAVGLPEAASILARAEALVPPELLTEPDDDRLFPFLVSRFEELDALAGEFYDVTAGSAAAILRYVSAHANEF